MKIKIKIDNVPSEIKAYEYSDGWRCGVEWMLSWGRGGSVLGRGTKLLLTSAAEQTTTG